MRVCVERICHCSNACAHEREVLSRITEDNAEPLDAVAVGPTLSIEDTGNRSHNYGDDENDEAVFRLVDSSVASAEFLDAPIRAMAQQWHAQETNDDLPGLGEAHPFFVPAVWW